MIRLPVIERHGWGWPRKDNDDDRWLPATAVYASSREVFETRYDWDAHFAAYEADVPYRLRKESVGTEANPRVVAFVLDVEPPKHAKPTDEWFASEAAKLDHLAAKHPAPYIYVTRGGYRVVYRLPEPWHLRDKSDAEAWKRYHSAVLDYIEATYSIAADRTCKDWTRLYRLPFVLRDGVEQHHGTDGDPGALGMWESPYEIARYRPTPEELARLAFELPDKWPAATPELLAHVKQRVADIGPAPEGERNAKAFQVCALVGRGFALAESEALPIIEAWNATNDPPLDNDELQTCIDNAFNYGQREVGEYRARFESEQRIASHLTGIAQGRIAPSTKQQSVFSFVASVCDTSPFAGKQAPEVPADEEHEQPADLTTAEATYADFVEAVAREVNTHKGAVTDEHAEKPFFQPASALFECEYPEDSWIIKDLLGDGGIAMITGKAKTAKSWIGTEIAVAVSTGTPVFGRYKTWQGGVMYFYTEDLKRAIRNRLRALLVPRKLDYRSLGKLYVQPRERAIDVTNLVDCIRIIASVRWQQRNTGSVKLVILDPLRNIHAFDENDSTAMSTVFENVRMISVLTGATVLLVHHAKLADTSPDARVGDSIRGSGAIHGKLDGLIELTKPTADDKGQKFTAQIGSQVKGAKSAGRFELTLNLDDDANGEATQATWKVGVRGETGDEVQAELLQDFASELVYEYSKAIARKERPTTKELAKALGIKTERMVAARQIAVRQGLLRRTEKDSFTLTQAGREYVKTRTGVPEAIPDPTAESDDLPEYS